MFFPLFFPSKITFHNYFRAAAAYPRLNLPATGKGSPLNRTKTAGQAAYYEVSPIAMVFSIITPGIFFGTSLSLDTYYLRESLVSISGRSSIPGKGKTGETRLFLYSRGRVYEFYSEGVKGLQYSLYCIKITHL